MYRHVQGFAHPALVSIVLCVFALRLCSALLERWSSSIRVRSPLSARVDFRWTKHRPQNLPPKGEFLESPIGKAWFLPRRRQEQSCRTLPDGALSVRPSDLPTAKCVLTMST